MITLTNWSGPSGSKIQTQQTSISCQDFASVGIEPSSRTRTPFMSRSTRPIRKRKPDSPNKPLPTTSSSSVKTRARCRFCLRLQTSHPSLERYHNFMSNAGFRNLKVGKETLRTGRKATGTIFCSIWIYWRTFVCTGMPHLCSTFWTICL